MTNTNQNSNNGNVPEFKLKRVPHTIDDIIASLENKAQLRISKILQEFIDGFTFIRKYPRSVTFFGSARFPNGNEHYERARRLGSRIVKELDYAVVSGGGPGIMEGANRGAYEAKGKSVGLLIQLPEEQENNPYVNDYMSFHYFFIRKVVLSFSAEAFVFSPGGFGTLDEFFEILTLVQTGKIPRIPIILIGKDFWNPVHEFIKKNMCEDHKSIDEADMKLYTITEDEDEILEIIKNAPISRY